MSETNAPARVRRFLPMCAVVGLLLSASHAAAATALVRWLPRGGMATGYAVYIRNPGSPYGTTPNWSGNPAPATDGSISAQVGYAPSPAGTNYFTVTALGPNGESPIATEVRLGNGTPCRNDACTTKTSCDFSNVPDGTSCDDASFCNGPEVCLRGVCDTSPVRNCADSVACTVDTCDEAAGRCVHTGPPGCCLACDSDDPCLADACAQGDCSAPLGVEIEVNRVRLLRKKSRVKLIAKGTFEADASVNPAATGVNFEFRGPGGVVLYSAWIPPDRIREGATGGRYRFAVSNSHADAISNGIARLDFRVKGSTWLVSAKAETALLSDAIVEPTVTWLIRMGDAACVRRIGMACSQSTTASLCR